MLHDREEDSTLDYGERVVLKMAHITLRLWSNLGSGHHYNLLPQTGRFRGRKTFQLRLGGSGANFQRWERVPSETAVFSEEVPFEKLGGTAPDASLNASERYTP